MTLSQSLVVQQNLSHSLLSQCPDLSKVVKLIERGYRSPTVLVTGETGTGKELVARAIHEASTPSKPLVPVNCSDMTVDMANSLFYGHEVGAFTGAVKAHTGFCEEANGGTLFLDELAELHIDVQPMLLRVLQGHDYRRLGGTRQWKPNFKVVAATNRNLHKMVQARKFREDLWYRLNLFTIDVPPLSERPRDIPPLAQFFLTRNSQGVTFASETVKFLSECPWPGNVRELEHAIRRALLLAPEDATVLLPEHFQNERALKQEADCSLLSEKLAERLVTCFPTLTLKEVLGKVEAQVILKALEQEDWNIAQTAKNLGLQRPTLYERIREYNLQADK